MKAPILALALLIPGQLNAPTGFRSSATAEGLPKAAYPQVVKVDCATGSGSAFRIGPHVLISVAHVTNLDTCTIEGYPFTVLERRGDFTVLNAATDGPYLKPDCRGFVPGHRYVAIGFALGLDTLTEVELTALGPDGVQYALRDVFTVIPGQSGGAVIDADTGEAVGTVNAFNSELGLSWSTPLSGTQICEGKA